MVHVFNYILFIKCNHCFYQIVFHISWFWNFNLLLILFFNFMCIFNCYGLSDYICWFYCHRNFVPFITFPYIFINFIGFNVMLYLFCSYVGFPIVLHDAPPHSLKYSNMNPKVKTMEGVGVHSLVRSTSRVEGRVGALGWGLREVISESIIHTNQITSWLVRGWNTFGAQMNHRHTQTHKTHHDPNLKEATTFPPHSIFYA